MNAETVPYQNGAAPDASLISSARGELVPDSLPDSPTVFMVGNSPVMLEVFDQIRKFAACEVPVLITGESGTGKELVARAIHHHSGRAAAPFVAIKCAAVPATLMASELFGYEKGAFTGAATRKHGHVEHAQGGTLFLDEIGDMPIDLQGLLLRFLQEGEILRVGGRRPIKIDVRVVAATNVRLREAIAAGKLREDLYYRLNVLTIDLPPLRERAGDVEVLATYFLREIARELQREMQGFMPRAIASSWLSNSSSGIRSWAHQGRKARRRPRPTLPQEYWRAAAGASGLAAGKSPICTSAEALTHRAVDGRWMSRFDCLMEHATIVSQVSQYRQKY